MQYTMERALTANELTRMTLRRLSIEGEESFCEKGARPNICEVMIKSMFESKRHIVMITIKQTGL